jgi:hypothetical protein
MRPHTNTARAAQSITALVSLAVVLALLGSLLVSDMSSPGFSASKSVKVRRSMWGMGGHAGRMARRRTQSVVLTVDPTQLGNQFSQGAIGLSVEADRLATSDIDASHKSLVALMRRLGPAVLRIGGNSLDYSWWTSNGEASPSWATSVTTPAELMSLRGLLDATGWSTILGVDLGHFDPSRAANEALTAEQILGPRLLGFEIGNEPNDYAERLVKLRHSPYGPSEYIKEIATYGETMRAAVPNIRLYGPDLSSSPSAQVWLPAIAASKASSLTAITEHYYPTSYSIAQGLCKATSLPTAGDILAPPVREYEDSVIRRIVEVGRATDREMRISETNTTSSCDVSGGPDTSPVFASALWSLDWALRSASAGISGINFHGHFGLCGPNTFSPICAPNAADAIRGQVMARPEFYGLVAARELEGGNFAPVEIAGSNGAENLTAYATVHPKGVLMLAIDNFATHGVRDVLVKVPGYNHATGESLSAPSIMANAGITLGHASFDAEGLLRPKRTRIPKLAGFFQLQLRPTSAVVLTARR